MANKIFECKVCDKKYFLHENMGEYVLLQHYCAEHRELVTVDWTGESLK